ncbi:hypothetical protein ACWA5Z_10100 [Testudinibacter sp. P80/BLE/0925]|uniref:hypothetical protein n=1 Tax=Testudinibacter sp. TW-1 TaxID=3417757 RepID=UPI003D36F1CE
MKYRYDKDDLRVSNLAVSGPEASVMPMLNTHLQIGLYDQHKSLKALLRYFAEQNFEVTPLFDAIHRSEELRTYVVKLSHDIDDEILLQCYVEPVNASELPFDFDTSLQIGKVH